MQISGIGRMLDIGRERELGRDLSFWNRILRMVPLAHFWTFLTLESRVFWQNDGSGIQQRPDFWDVIANKVDVYRSEIKGFSDHGITLRDRTAIPIDVLFCATGWDSSLKFLDQSESARLGLPVPVEREDKIVSEHWKQLEQHSRSAVLQRFPRLADPPPHFLRPALSTPYRLYKAIAPLNDSSIVLLGHIQVGNNFGAAEVQALWATAYLDGRIAMPSKENKEQEIAETNAWCRLRYLDKGQSGTFFYFDQVHYMDMLLADLCLKSHKAKGIKGIFRPVLAQDLKGLVDEYIQKGRTVKIGSS